MDGYRYRQKKISHEAQEAPRVPYRYNQYTTCQQLLAIRGNMWVELFGHFQQSVVYKLWLAMQLFVALSSRGLSVKMELGDFYCKTQMVHVLE